MTNSNLNNETIEITADEIPAILQSYVQQFRSNDSTLCREVVSKGLLTEEQMHHAAERYHLGKSREGHPIYWLINQQGHVLDGRIDSSWASILLQRPPKHELYVIVTHCLFGLHLLNHGDSPNSIIAIVESERTAFVLSELFPKYIWMAYSSYFTIDLLKPLQGHRVIIYPKTDTTLESFLFFSDLAKLAHSVYHLDITVDKTLESHATEEQKTRNIDLLDFILEH